MGNKEPQGYCENVGTINPQKDPIRYCLVQNTERNDAGIPRIREILEEETFDNICSKDYQNCPLYGTCSQSKPKITYSNPNMGPTRDSVPDSRCDFELATQEDADASWKGLKEIIKEARNQKK